MELTFDIRGNVTPAHKVNLNIDDVKQIFVNSFEPDSTRYPIFKRYEQFLADFANLVTPTFTQWINGSFISTSVNPNDIDFVTLIDAEIYQLHQALIEQWFRLQGARNLYGVDAYTIRHYPEHHERRWQTEMDLAYWNNWFSRTRANRAGHKFNKGFVELNFP
ncbi:DUF6932 family protein [Telluribacter sp.]|jgi:hypothetical protein|uniref:DUF6932 family protein n=1 Tax=Telluribacter sp. TaxID=1978767 RepID=UPI002E135D0A|nr:hypothetical protein [Telluribacter sp.]